MEMKSFPLSIVGCGPGSPEYVTAAARQAVARADVLVGSKRLMELFADCTAEKVFVEADITALLEQIAALPPEARYGVWTFEWYWNQPGVPHVAEFVQRYVAANNGKYPSQRSWFGYVSVHALALAAENIETKTRAAGG